MLCDHQCSLTNMWGLHKTPWFDLRLYTCGPYLRRSWLLKANGWTGFYLGVERETNGAKIWLYWILTYLRWFVTLIPTTFIDIQTQKRPFGPLCPFQNIVLNHGMLLHLHTPGEKIVFLTPLNYYIPFLLAIRYVPSVCCSSFVTSALGVTMVELSYFLIKRSALPWFTVTPADLLTGSCAQVQPEL